MAIRTRHSLPLLIPALLLAGCATRGPVPAASPDNPPATTTSPSPNPTPKPTLTPTPTPHPSISCPAGTHLRAGECLINPSTTA